MGRRSSGQVLIGAATLMLVILLTMAASLPVINTSIDPSSMVYNFARFAVTNAIDDLITRMSAYQCATALWYADNRHKYIDFTSNAKGIEDRIKNSLIQTASKSTYNLELRSVRVSIPTAKINILSTGWDGNPNSPSAGNVEISMAIHVSVSFEYRTKNSGANFQRYTAWYEEYLTIEGEGGIIKKAPWQGLPWVEFGLGLVPIVGALVGNIKGVKFALPLKVTQYKAVFDNQRVFAGVELDDLSRRLELVMLKPRDKVERDGGTGPDGHWFKTIRWVEYNKIDWGAIAIGIAIDLIPWGKVVGTAIKGIGIGESDDIMRQIWKREVQENMHKIKKTNTDSGTTDYFGYPKSNADVVAEFYEKLGSRQQEALRRKAIAKIHEFLAEKLAQALGGNLDDYLNMIDKYSEELAMKIDGIELYQSTAGSDKIMAYYANRNPLVWVGLPLHNGNSLFGVCVWLIGAYYPGDA
jgi:RNA polymerase-interacting CarD/CdnL/TRCF family regulator